MVAAWAIALVCGSSAMALAHYAARVLPAPRPLEELSYYPSGQMLKQATLGHAETAADLAWIRAVQYYGEHRRTDNKFVRMYHVFDILTSMAPRFVSAYVFGGFTLAQEGRDFVSAERLMLKGLEANPGNAELAFRLGFLYFVRPGGRDLRRAAEYFEQAARMPHAPSHAARFAAYARQHAGDLRLAYELWADVQAHSPNEYLRDMAGKEMEKIQMAIESGHMDAAVHKLTVPKVVFGSGSP
jgi:TPR repeat protein